LLTHPATIPLSTRSLTHLADQLRRHRTVRGTRWRRLDPCRQALLVLAHLRNGDTYTRLAAGFGVGVATVFRYVREALDLLAAAAPDLEQVVIGIGPAFAGVAVHDRYAVYDQAGNFANGLRHQLCCAHLLCDLADAAETYPDHVWPIQCTRALRGLIHAANLARAAGHTEIDPAVRDDLIREFRDRMIVGRNDVPRIGGPATSSHPPGTCSKTSTTATTT
jgi:hypothetical protein